MTPVPYQNRVTKLRATLPPQAAVLVADPQHIRYLTGFESLAPGEREAFLLVANEQATLFYTSFSPVAQHSFLEYVAKCTISAVGEKLLPTTILAIDMQAITAAEYQELQRLSLTLTTWQADTLWQQRMHKDTQELEFIARAVTITKKVLEQTLATLSPGVSEQTVRRAIDANFLLAGADGAAFPTIVAFGEHAALPHHQPTEKELEPEMAVLIDCGVQIAGYCSDMTRTVWFGTHPDPEFSKIDALAHQAFTAAQTALQQNKPTAQMVDAAARQVISQAGYGEQFIHTTGHGLGLSIHEPPSLNARSEQVIEPGMVITIEPGIYLRGKFGVRFEETVLLQVKSG